MGRHNDLDSQTGNRGQRPGDGSLSQAMIERRRQYLAARGGPAGGTDTATIQARLAAARAAEDLARRTAS